MLCTGTEYVSSMSCVISSVVISVLTLCIRMDECILLVDLFVLRMMHVSKSLLKVVFLKRSACVSSVKVMMYPVVSRDF